MEVTASKFFQQGGVGGQIGEKDGDPWQELWTGELLLKVMG
jgi:hypothetical protein